MSLCTLRINPSLCVMSSCHTVQAALYTRPHRERDGERQRGGGGERDRRERESVRESERESERQQETDSETESERERQCKKVRDCERVRA